MTIGCSVTLLAEIEAIHSSFSTGTWSLMQRSVLAPSAIAGLRSSFQRRICVFFRLTGVYWALAFTGFFCDKSPHSHTELRGLRHGQPPAGPDHEVAGWFHAHLTRTFVSVLRAFTEFGSSEWIGVVLFLLVVFFIWKRWWPSLVTLVVAVPGGMLLNELLKQLVHRHRPFVDGPFVDWSGYSFASGHTIGATLLYGQLALFILPAMKARHWRRLTVASAVLLIALVGFSRIALGAHFLTDVLAAIVFGVLWLAFCLFAGKPMRRSVVLTPGVPLVSEPALVRVEETGPPAQNFLS
jgi:undecaprenyl-diphosphatase